MVCVLLAPLRGEAWDENVRWRRGNRPVIEEKIVSADAVVSLFEIWWCKVVKNIVLPVDEGKNSFHEMVIALGGFQHGLL